MKKADFKNSRVLVVEDSDPMRLEVIKCLRKVDVTQITEGR
jgi:hypothetical protein